MDNHVYKTLEVTGSSRESMEDAVQAALTRTRATMHGLRWFEVADIRGHIEDGAISHWQVTVKIGLTLDSPE